MSADRILFVYFPELDKTFKIKMIHFFFLMKDANKHLDYFHERENNGNLYNHIHIYIYYGITIYTGSTANQSQNVLAL